MLNYAIDVFLLLFFTYFFIRLNRQISLFIAISASFRYVKISNNFYMSLLCIAMYTELVIFFALSLLQIS